MDGWKAFSLAAMSDSVHRFSLPVPVAQVMIKAKKGALPTNGHIPESLCVCIVVRVNHALGEQREKGTRGETAQIYYMQAYFKN